MSGYETDYLNIVRNIAAYGLDIPDRTGVGTVSSWGNTIRCDLSGNRVPILTTKKVSWKTAVRELLWMVSGSTNIRPLVKQGVSIWTDWPLKVYNTCNPNERMDRAEFEAHIRDDEEFAEEWGELGPVYGSQWRGWTTDFGIAHDQLQTVINDLRTNPFSRRHIISAWNVGDLSEMVLPPCHVLYQYRVRPSGELDGIVYQRSADMFLGVPFNLIGASALLKMIAAQTGYEPGELVWMGGDCHVYSNHTEQVLEQLTRIPSMYSPRMRINRVESIDAYRITDFFVTDYKPADAISAPVAV